MFFICLKMCSESVFDPVEKKLHKFSSLDIGIMILKKCWNNYNI